MRNLKEELPFFKQLMGMLKNQYGDNNEIVLHDWSEGIEQSIIAIENGHITGREVGSCGSSMGLEVMSGTLHNGDRYNYITRTKDGKILKSSTIYLRDDEGTELGSLCINTDISEYIQAKRVMDHLVPAEICGEREESGEFFASDINELLGFLINQAMEEAGKPLEQMTKEDKCRALRYLDSKGAFLISKSGNRICKALGISKFTLYNYLDEIRSNSGAHPVSE